MDRARQAVASIAEFAEAAVKNSYFHKNLMRPPSSQIDLPNEIFGMIFKYSVSDPMDIFVFSLVCRQFRAIARSTNYWAQGISARLLSTGGNTNRLRHCLGVTSDPITATIDSNEVFCSSFVDVLMQYVDRLSELSIIARNEAGLETFDEVGYQFTQLSVLELASVRTGASMFDHWVMPSLRVLRLKDSPLLPHLIDGTGQGSLQRLHIQPSRSDTNSTLSCRLNQFLARTQLVGLQEFSLCIGFANNHIIDFQPGDYQMQNVTLMALTNLHISFAFKTVAHFEMCKAIVRNIEAPLLQKLCMQVVFVETHVIYEITQEGWNDFFFDGRMQVNLQDFNIKINCGKPSFRNGIQWQFGELLYLCPHIETLQLHSNISEAIKFRLPILINLSNIELQGIAFNDPRDVCRFVEKYKGRDVLVRANDAIIRTESNA